MEFKLVTVTQVTTQQKLTAHHESSKLRRNVSNAWSWNITVLDECVVYNDDSVGFYSTFGQWARDHSPYTFSRQAQFSGIPFELVDKREGVGDITEGSEGWAGSQQNGDMPSIAGHGTSQDPTGQALRSLQLGSVNLVMSSSRALKDLFCAGNLS